MIACRVLAQRARVGCPGNGRAPHVCKRQQARPAYCLEISGATMSTTTSNSPPKALIMAMEPPPRPSSALFDVYLRLRPSNSASRRFLTVEERHDSHSTHITVRPLVNDNRKRAVERFAFTQVFEEDARQMDIFEGTGIVPMIQGVIGAPGCHGRDGLLATLGVTGSGKVHISVWMKVSRILTL
jgi:hypothetical protein